MPRFYFDIDDGRATPDDTGYEFADLNAVRGQVQRLLGELIAHSRSVVNSFQIRIEVRDETGDFAVKATLVAVIDEVLDHNTRPLRRSEVVTEPADHSASLGGCTVQSES
ncbi:DUF6894 family protein [Methylobacterium sp. JK268]